MNELIKKILLKRGILAEQHQAFLNPDYGATKHNPFLLPDMDKAVKRIMKAHNKNERIVVYGDYDVDGMCATAILVDAFNKFGLNIETYTPDRFTEGYGLNMDAIRVIAKSGASLIITVDCGSLSHYEIKEANKLGIDIIVTDHHAVSETLPPAVAVINPHRSDSKYPFADLAGCGVAFKLVQALQTKLTGLPEGQEKWLLDLVALGTVCDIVPLLDENRNNVYWGIEVMKKTRRLGLRALIAVAKLLSNEINARKIGFVIGPRLNAAGRIATARSALELLVTDNNQRALELAQNLDSLNGIRRAKQDKIFSEACEKISEPIDPVIIIGDKDWNEGVIGIVASKLMEKYNRPVFVMSVNKNIVKGSGRSFGDFNIAEAIAATSKYLEKGGGHAAAGGVSLLPENIDEWRDSMNKFYASLSLKNQENFLLPNEDLVWSDLAALNTGLVHELEKLEPFGLGNNQPVFHLNDIYAKYVDRIGKDGSHLKLTISDKNSQLKFLAFNPPNEWFIEAGEKIDIWVNLEINEWQGSQTVEGRILRLDIKST